MRHPRRGGGGIRAAKRLCFQGVFRKTPPGLPALARGFALADAGCIASWTPGGSAEFVIDLSLSLKLLCLRLAVGGVVPHT